MKNFKKVLFLFLITALTLSLFACAIGGSGDDGGEPCAACVDENEDGKCDVCKNDVQKEPTANDVNLFKDGEPCFQFVLAKNVSLDVRKMVESTIKATFRNKYGIDITVVTESTADDEVKNVEILVGSVTSRGEEYEFDRYSLGKKGYIYKIIGTKIIINAGSDETLVETLEKFAQNVLGMEEDEITDLSMTAKQEKYKVQDGYKITALTLDGKDMKGYTIAADRSSVSHKNAALNIQDSIYGRTGYWFEVVKLDEATENSIVIKAIDKVYGDESYKVYAKGSQLIIECAFDNLMEKATAQFILNKITNATGEVDFEGTVYKQDISVVYYEDFGAKGDGKTNDYQAIYDAHVFANQCGQIVKATKDKIYYLSDPTITAENGKKAVSSIPIKTNVDWTGAYFTIDDSEIDYFKEKSKATTSVFKVTSDYDKVTWKATDSRYSEKIAALGKVGYTYETNKIDLGLGYPAMLIIYNNEHEVYRRSGASYSGAGQAQHELIVVDKDGNIDESTPFMFDYEKITSIEIIRLDIEPITIKGGNFTTIACGIDAMIIDENGEEKMMGYYTRGLSINRSYTTVDGVEHYMKGEVTLEQYANDYEGVHYNGFYNATEANEVTIQNCIMTGRRYYRLAGTYEFSANLVNKIILKKCIQSNFWIDEEGNPSETDTGIPSMISMKAGNKSVQYCWGLGGTNFCKNMHYIDSKLSRFDAHCGLYDGSIEGSEIQFFEIIGKGNFLVKDTKWYSTGTGEGRNALVYMRDDYGCTWEGNFTLDNVTAYVSEGDFYLFRHNYNNWYYGYKCHIPSIEIKDLTVCKLTTREPVPESYSLINVFTTTSMVKNPKMHNENESNDNPIGVPEFIKITSNKNGYTYNVPLHQIGEFLSGVKFYTGETQTTYAYGKQGAFMFT